MNALIPNPTPRRLSMPAARRLKTRGFTLVETVITVAALAILGGVGYVAFHEVDTGTRSTKMRSDVRVLNEAVTMYIASGGSLSSADTTKDVLIKLKSRMSDSDAAKHTGVSTGSFVDHRLEGEMQSVREAATTQSRVMWNQTEQRFEMKNSGVIGVKRFRLNHALASAPIATESRDGIFTKPTTTGGWMWNHQNNGGSGDDGLTGPTIIGTEAFPTNPDPTTEPIALNAAIVQEGGGDGFLAATTVTPNEETDSLNGAEALYAPGVLDEGTTAPVGDEALALSKVKKLKRETDKDNKKEVALERLQTPAIEPPGSGYLRTDFPKVVTVANAESYASVGNIKYRVDQGAWQDYSGGVKVDSDHVLQFKAEPVDAELYAASFNTNDYYYGVSDVFSGSSIVQFQEIEGGLNLDFFLSEANTFLTHGSAFKAKNGPDGAVLVEAGEVNTMKVMSASFSNVLPGEQFLLGEVLYHNGTTFDDSHAEKAKILFDITFTDPNAITDMKMPLELINTDNKGNADMMADVVTNLWPGRAFRFDIDGRRFRLVVEFVAVDKEGFSDGTSFHVYEGRTARAELRGTFVIEQ